MPWADNGPGRVDDGVIRGNREGLLLSRAAIDQALEKGESIVQQPEMFLMHVILAERPQLPPTNVSTERWAIVGCCVAFLTACGTFLFGLVEIVRRLF